MASNELVYLLFANSVQILEFVQRGKFLYVQPVRRNYIRLSLQQMFSFETSYVGNGSEHVRQVRGRAFHTVSMVNLPFPCLLVYAELQIKRVELVQIEFHNDGTFG